MDPNQDPDADFDSLLNLDDLQMDPNSFNWPLNSYQAASTDNISYFPTFSELDTDGQGYLLPEGATFDVTPDAQFTEALLNFTDLMQTSPEIQYLPSQPEMDGMLDNLLTLPPSEATAPDPDPSDDDKRRKAKREKHLASKRERGKRYRERKKLGLVTPKPRQAKPEPFDKDDPVQVRARKDKKNARERELRAIKRKEKERVALASGAPTVGQRRITRSLSKKLGELVQSSAENIQNTPTGNQYTFVPDFPTRQVRPIRFNPFGQANNSASPTGSQEPTDGQTEVDGNDSGNTGQNSDPASNYSPE